MVARSFLFVHSPLVGPSSVRRLARLAAADAAAVALPDLAPSASAARPHEDFTGRAIEAAADLAPPVVVIGHSGAGAFLPTIGAAVGPPAFLVFVDAVLPPRAGRHRATAALLEMLDRQTEHGVLRRWLDWWPAETVAQLVPDPADREELAADMPRLPRSFYDRDVEVPSGWSDERCGYVQLSGAYDAEHADAVARGWPTRRLASNHLAIFTEPARVLEAILHVVERIDSSTPSGATSGRD